MTELPEINDDEKYRLLENRSEHAYVMNRDTGKTELIPWSPLNRAVYQHNLRGLLVDRSEVWELERPDDALPSIKIEPHTDETGTSGFVLRYGDHSMFLPNHEKKRLVKALVDAYERGNANPLDDLYAGIQDTEVAPFRVNALAENPVFEGAVEVTDRGWFIHNHLLLTFDNEFFHPNVEHTSRSGQILDRQREAYELDFTADSGQTQLKDFEEVASPTEEFIAKAMWAVKMVPSDDPRTVPEQ